MGTSCHIPCAPMLLSRFYTRQVTMNNCKFHGFWRILLLSRKGRASLTNCKVDLTTAHTYPTEHDTQPVVSSKALVSMLCCQLHCLHSPIAVCSQDVPSQVPMALLAALLMWRDVPAPDVCLADLRGRQRVSPAHDQLPAEHHLWAHTRQAQIWICQRTGELDANDTHPGPL
jgi:hypothetical protein